MEKSYAVKKAGESLVEFFWDITCEVISDSAGVYIAIGCTAAATLVSSFFGAFGHGSEIIKLHNGLIDGVSGVYLLLPPFVLAIIAMFPAFSETTKRVLAQKIKNDKAFGAVFLNEFAFLTFWSLVVLGHSTVTKMIYSSLGPRYDAGFWIALNFSLSVIFILSVAFEIFHSIKIMYLLVLREYYS